MIARLASLAVAATLLAGCGSSSSTVGPTTPAAKPPVANAGGPYTGQAGSAVSFNGSASTDPQGEALTYAWNFGDSGTGSGVSPDHTYTAAGTYTVSLTVTDTSNLTSTAATSTATIAAAPTAPAPDFSLSASPQSVALAAGASEVFDLSAPPLNGFSGVVTVTVSGLPTGVTQGASSYTLTAGVVSQVTLTAASTVSASIGAITVTASSGNLTHTAQVELTTGAPPDYSLTLSTEALSMVASTSQTITVTATAENGFTGAVAGTLTGLPNGVTASPASFSLPLGMAVTVTLTAAGLTMGNNVVTVGSSSGTTAHNLPLSMNVGTQAQDFVLATPVSLNVAPGGTASFDVAAGGIGGFQGTVNIAVSGLPAGVTANKSNFSVNLSPALVNSSTVTLTGASTLGSGTVSFTVTGSVGTQTHQNSVVLTQSPGNTESATVNIASPGTAFPSYFIGFSMPDETLLEFTGTGAATSPSFINLLSNLKTYVGSPSIRSTLTASTLSELAALTSGATFTVGNVTTSPHYFLTTSSGYAPAADAVDVQQVIGAVGSTNLLGLELDNEPDLYPGVFRPATWSYADYLNETAGFQTAFAPDITPPQLVVTAAAGRTWDPGIPAIMTQMGGQISTYTAHNYALTSCNNVPTVAQLMQDKFTHNYYARYAGLVQTFGAVPVRVGETNSVSCEGYAGVSNTLAASLWIVDMGFEAKAAGTVGFNLHSNGSSSGAAPYDIGFNNNGSMSVYAPFYGVLFLAEAIQNGAKPLPVTIKQSAGNMKVWATIDAANTVRVVLLEKDTDGLANSKTVALTLGSYTKPGTLTTMAAASLSATSGIAIAGQTFDGTTNGLLTGTAVPPQLMPASGVYTITVADGTATMLTVPQ
jgi:PKD repeat protein